MILVRTEDLLSVDSNPRLWLYLAGSFVEVVEKTASSSPCCCGAHCWRPTVWYHTSVKYVCAIGGAQYTYICIFVDNMNTQTHHSSSWPASGTHRNGRRTSHQQTCTEPEAERHKGPPVFAQGEPVTSPE